MSDDRFNPEENPPPLTPCRRYVAPRNDYVTADEMFEWLDKFERMTGTGKYRAKPKPTEPVPARDRGEGHFGTEPPEPDAKQRAAGGEANQ